MIPMKAGKSTLNPHAEAYVPLSKRVLPTKDSAKSPGIENKDGNEAGLLPTGVTPAQYQQQLAQRTEQYYMQHSPSDDFFGSSSQGQHEFTDTEVLDMEFDIDMQYLRRTFRDISEESLSQVYLVNKCDLEETVDMLNQLELPDCLDIGDESEPGPSSGEAYSQKLKKVSDESSSTVASSSGSSCSEPVS
ncbi:polyadenylate-binding protein-interacting protein 5-like [Ipomoea triloba]|uniref:polyadenylate-binding protein-interacting protein 5-like n=1 Tax=Ipomoea triloba TaxID=35885 RepID=UPI00125E1BAF|nr:polyadenylate-binding protein-interacting protein 5-like [Ipomoea triloba]XP_031117944.1 polyadenylate-binding protein-interacting protein 5-like [Ipomoea triloba]